MECQHGCAYHRGDAVVKALDYQRVPRTMTPFDAEYAGNMPERVGMNAGDYPEVALYAFNPYNNFVGFYRKND
jgi:hypothetical protein